MTIKLCTHKKTDEIEDKLEKDVKDYAMHDLHALAVTYEEIDGQSWG